MNKDLILLLLVGLFFSYLSYIFKVKKVGWWKAVGLAPPQSFAGAQATGANQGR
jgi:hypothetical protein